MIDIGGLMTKQPVLIFSQSMPEHLHVQQREWEAKMLHRMDEYAVAVAMYKVAASSMIHCTWLTPVKAGYQRGVGWLSVRQIAESIAGCPIPPISPVDAFALSVETDIPVELWLMGCGDA